MGAILSTPFISRQDLSDYLGRDVTADDGATIAVDSACAVVRTLTEQDFSETTETIYLDGSGTDLMFLPQRPVSAAGTVEVNGTAVTDYTYTESGKLIRTSDDEPTWSTWGQTYQPVAYWPEGRQNVSVTYTHGGSVPNDVRMVAMMIAYRLVTQGGATQEQVGDVRKTYAVAATDLTNGEKAILRKYRR